jgi:hypothetical protein
MNRLAPYLIVFSSLAVVTGIVGILIPIKLQYKEFFLPGILLLTLIFNSRSIIISKYESFIFLSILGILSGGIFSFYFQNNYFSLLSLCSFFSVSIWLIVWAKNSKYHYKSFKIYLLIVKYTLASTLFVLLLDLFNLINIDGFGLPPYFDMGFLNKYLIDGNNDVYGIVFNHIVVMKNYIKPIFFLQNIGTYCGISYEPHLFGFFVSPAFFVFLKTKQNLWALITLFLLFTAFSVTNLVVLLISISLVINKRFLLILALLIVIVISQFLSDIILYSSIGIWVLSKAESRSQADISNVFDKILDWSSIIGDGIFFTAEGNNGLGFINGVLLLFFALLIVFLIVKQYNKDKFSAAIILYILLHSLKFPLNVFQYPYILFIIFSITSNHGYFRHDIRK